MRIIIKWVIAITLILSSFLVSTYNWAISEYNYDSSRKFENFDTFYQNELQISAKENTRPNNEELLVRVSEEKLLLPLSTFMDLVQAVEKEKKLQTNFPNTSVPIPIT